MTKMSACASSRYLLLEKNLRRLNMYTPFVLTWHCGGLFSDAFLMNLLLKNICYILHISFPHGLCFAWNVFYLWCTEWSSSGIL